MKFSIEELKKKAQEQLKLKEDNNETHPIVSEEASVHTKQAVAEVPAKVSVADRLAELKERAFDTSDESAGEGTYTSNDSKSGSTKSFLDDKDSTIETQKVSSSGLEPCDPSILSNSDIISSRISDLQDMLQESNPGYEQILHVIHRAMVTDTDIAHILNEEQIGIICAGLSKKKNIVLVAATVKNKAKKITEMDL